MKKIILERVLPVALLLPLVPTLQRGNVTRTLLRPDETAGAVIQGSHAGAWEPEKRWSMGTRERLSI